MRMLEQRRLTHRVPEVAKSCPDAVGHCQCSSCALKDFGSRKKKGGGTHKAISGGGAVTACHSN